LQVSVLGLGCSNFGRETDDATARDIIFTALDKGVTLLDTAARYGEYGGSEECLGRLLGGRRKDIVLATKFGLATHPDAARERDASRRNVMIAVEDSLRRLKTDWIDLYQVHFPDPATPLDETLRALNDLIQQGKVRYIGLSNESAWRVVEAQWLAATNGLNPFISCQEDYSLLVRAVERELVPAMAAHGLGLMAYFPLASGLLTGKYRRDAMPEGARLTEKAFYRDRFVDDANWAKVEGLRAFAEERGRTLLHLAFAWLLARPQLATILPGATSASQLEQNIAALDWKLTSEDLARIDTIAPI
jgi:aryl-alcohol dehydrogenase-like predicted oxidoreductase